MRTGTTYYRKSKAALILLSLVVILSPKWHATCFSLTMEDIQAIQATQASSLAHQIQRTAVVDSSAPWEMILAQEQALAKQYFGDSKQVAATQIPAPTATTPKAPAKAEIPPLQTQYRPTETAKTEEKVAEPEEKKSGVETLPVERFATQQEFLRMAKVDFDAARKLWSATWEKPQMFHFGMLLKPALVEKMTPGESYSFESQGKEAMVTRTLGNDLVLKRGNEITNLSASDLRSLLHDKISADGVQIFLDRRGNLVMQASGDKALSLSSNTKL